MRRTAMTLTLLVAGCTSVPTLTGPDAEAICDGTRASRTAHAAALAQDGGDASVVTGQKLISQIDAACAMM